MFADLSVYCRKETQLMTADDTLKKIFTFTN